LFIRRLAFFWLWLGSFILHGERHGYDGKIISRFDDLGASLIFFTSLHCGDGRYFVVVEQGSRSPSSNVALNGVFAGDFYSP
jgi:hypothetical protein